MIGRERFGWMAAPDFVRPDREPLPVAVQPSPCAVRAMAVGALDRTGIDWHEAFVGGGVATLAAAAAGGLAIAALSRGAAPAELIDVTGMLSLPTLPEQEVGLYATASDAASREVIRVIRTVLASRS